MKNTIYIYVMLAFMMACGTATKESAEEEYAEAPESSQKYNYSGSFQMADMANFDIARQWNESIKNGDTEKLASLLADSVTIYLWDGMIYNTTRDSLMTAIEGFLGSIKDLEIIYHAGMAINSTDRGDNWALSWTTEQYTDPEGKLMRISMQENWLIENGQIRSVRQYGQKVPDEAEIEASGEEDFTYSGSWEKADDSLTEIVLGWNNALASPTDLETAASYLADSVSIYFSDGTSIISTKDSVMRAVKEFVAQTSNLQVDFDAIMAVRSTDRNQDVVLSWTDEHITNLEGEVEHVWIHEDYLIENGKISLVRQYVMKEAPK